MKRYGGIDLHSNNSVIVILNEKDETVYKKKHKNDLREILSCLLPFRGQPIAVNQLAGKGAIVPLMIAYFMVEAGWLTEDN